MTRPVYLSETEKEMIETIRLYGSYDFNIREKKLVDRLMTSGRIVASEPGGKNNEWITVTMKQNWSA